MYSLSEINQQFTKIFNKIQSNSSELKNDIEEIQVKLLSNYSIFEENEASEDLILEILNGFYVIAKIIFKLGKHLESLIDAKQLLEDVLDVALDDKFIMNCHEPKTHKIREKKIILKDVDSTESNLIEESISIIKIHSRFSALEEKIFDNFQNYACELSEFIKSLSQLDSFIERFIPNYLETDQTKNKFFSIWFDMKNQKKPKDKLIQSLDAFKIKVPTITISHPMEIPNESNKPTCSM